MTVTAFFFQRRAGHGGGCLTGQLCSPHAVGIDQLLAPSEHYPGTLFASLCLSLVPSVHSSKYTSTLHTPNTYKSNCANVVPRTMHGFWFW